MLQRRSPFLLELFQYRQRERRAPLEDFLTVALVGFIRTLPTEKQFEVCISLFVASCQRSTFLEACRKASKHRWDTQLILPNGKRPDIVFWLDDVPAIVIENKIWGGIAVHQKADESDDEDSNALSDLPSAEDFRPGEITQLVTYGTWLCNARLPSRWPGSLVLLTHGTPPPNDFLASNVSTYGAVPHTCRWSTLHAWLMRYVQEESRSQKTDSASAFLAADLTIFLRKKGLVMRPLSFADIDALGMQFALRGSLDAAFAETLSAIKSTYADLVASEGARAISHDKSGLIVWGWVYLRGKGMPRTTYFAWGFRFPGISTYWEDLYDQLPAENHPFCFIGSDAKSFRMDQIPAEKRPVDWLVSDEGKGLIGAVPLSALPAAQTLPQAFTLWTVSQFAALKPLIGCLCGNE